MAAIGQDIEIAKHLLQSGEVIGIPTETVYGLAGNALNEDAILKIFKVKNRPFFDPLIVHIPNLGHIEKYVLDLPQKAKLLAENFWPGPLTLLLKKQAIIPDLITSGLETVAIRIPNHSLTLSLLNNLDFPLAAPSANPFGYISPTSAKHVDNQLGNQIPYILNGGDCSVGIESTIVGFEANNAIVYRLGGLSIDAIEKVIGKVKVMTHSSSNPKAPGMIKSHYAPRKPLLIQSSVSSQLEEPNKVGFLGFQFPHPTIPAQNQLILSPTGNFDEAAKNLFSYLRQLDNLDIDYILTEYLPEEGLGRAINDRIRRATAK